METDALQIDQVERMYQEFPLTSVCRADLEGIGFDTTDVDDSTMRDLVDKMQDSYLDMIFWEDLKTLAEIFEIKRK